VTESWAYSELFADIDIIFNKITFWLAFVRLVRSFKIINQFVVVILCLESGK